MRKLTDEQYYERLDREREIKEIREMKRQRIRDSKRAKDRAEFEVLVNKIVAKHNLKYNREEFSRYFASDDNNFAWASENLRYKTYLKFHALGPEVFIYIFNESEDEAVRLYNSYKSKRYAVPEYLVRYKYPTKGVPAPYYFTAEERKSLLEFIDKVIGKNSMMPEWLCYIFNREFIEIPEYDYYDEDEDYEEEDYEDEDYDED